jgi:hypothetical protein
MRKTSMYTVITAVRGLSLNILTYELHLGLQNDLISKILEVTVLLTG